MVELWLKINRFASYMTVPSIDIPSSTMLLADMSLVKLPEEDYRFWRTECDGGGEAEAYGKVDHT